MFTENPYESPETVGGSLEPVKVDVRRELFGGSKEDMWAWVGVALLVVGCFPQELWQVGALFAAATLCLVAYLVTTAPKLSRRSNMPRWMKIYAWANNIFYVFFHIVVVAAKVSSMLSSGDGFGS